MGCLRVYTRSSTLKCLFLEASNVFGKTAVLDRKMDVMLTIIWADRDSSNFILFHSLKVLGGTSNGQILPDKLQLGSHKDPTDQHYLKM